MGNFCAMQDGTSPRLWGDYFASNATFRRPRYIPTSVGRLKSLTPSASAGTVHPHVCGEIACSSVNCLNSCGTSPRLWGDLSTGGSTASSKRYIPTSVGRFLQHIRAITPNAVHPHVCGEIAVVPVTIVTCGGTSPRLWGDSGMSRCIFMPFRYIPTSVGRFDRSIFLLTRITVHPHVCGEISISRLRLGMLAGTSPRLWGDSALMVLINACGRYIPTSVGRLFSSTIASILNSVHPHVCGEILS